VTTDRVRRAAGSAVVLAAFPVALAGCAEDWTTLPIRSYDVEAERRVTVEGHCNEDGRVVVVDEDDGRVELRLEIRGERRGDCLDCPSATLDEPLGERAVVDASTGDPVPFRPELC
jgi:hypothetical protein